MSKSQFIRAFFDAFGHKVGRLPRLFEAGFPEEAFTLCIVYLDRLASGYYRGDPGKNHENFCRALRELSGKPLFALLHPRELSEQAQQHFPNLLPVIALLTLREPLALLDEPWLGDRKILLLEPRRVAARAIARRMAWLRGESVGATVGYRMRFDTCVSRATRVEVKGDIILALGEVTGHAHRIKCWRPFANPIAADAQR